MSTETVHGWGRSSELTGEQLLAVYRSMVWDQVLDKRSNALFRMGKLMSMFHGASGQEATNVAAGYALQDGDCWIPSHRGKSIYLIRGMDLRSFVAGSMGKKEGVGQGRSMVGSHMLGDPSLGLLPIGGSVGSPSTQAAGAALAFKLQNKPAAALVVCGDGGANRGDVHEAMNFAGALGLGVVFLFINNGWSLSVPASVGLSVDSLASRAAGYGMEGISLDGGDFFAIYDALWNGLRAAREQRTPILIESRVNRSGAHSVNDPDLVRTAEQKARDGDGLPIQRFTGTLMDRGLLDAEAIDRTLDEVEDEMAEAIAYAESCSEPGYDELVLGVYDETRPEWRR
jgi:TPP-dependent pyruvate/acetoin dehydrogenase alpha subunit